MSVSMLSEQLVKAGVSTQVYATTANGKNELPVQPGKAAIVDGVTVTYFRRLTKDHSHFSPSLLKELWKEAAGFDVVHIHAWWNLVSVFSCMIALMRGRQVLISARGTLSPYSFQNKNKTVKRLIHQLINKPLLKRCHFHVTSTREEDAIKELVTPKSITNIANFVKLPVYKAVDHVSSDKFKLIFFSRIEEKKGLDILIDALSGLNFPYVLTIAGDGDINYINELKSQAKKKAIEENINWVGFQNEHKFELLRQHDLLILPSYDENFGNVVIESLSEGTAVLLSKFVGLSGYVAKNNFGWECELNAEAIGNMINIVQKKTSDLTSIRLNAPLQVRRDFDEMNLTRQYINMYNTIITNG